MSRPFVELSEVIRVHYGSALKAEQRESSGRYTVFGSAGRIGQHDAALFDHASVIIGRKGSVGAVTWAPEGGWVIDTAFYVELLHPESCDPRYLYYALLNANLAQHTITTSIPGLSRNDILRTKVLMPSFPEQRRIAALLDQADGIRRKRREALRLVDELIRATFLETVGPQHPKHHAWPHTTIAWMAADLDNAMRTGPFGSDLLHSEFVDEGVAVIGIDNAVRNRFEWDERRYITQEKYQKLRRYTLHPGDVIVTIMGTVGRTAVVPDGIPTAINSKHLAAITLNPAKALPEYLALALRLHPDVQQQIAGKSRGGTCQQKRDTAPTTITLAPATRTASPTRPAG